MSKKKADKKNKELKKKGSYEAVDIAPAITQAARSMRTALSHMLSDSGLYAGQDGVIMLLAEEDGMTPGHLAEKLGVKAPTMTRTIGRMEAQGFLERRADENDGRLAKVHLTELGRTSVEQISRSAENCGALAAKGLSDKEIKTLIKLLRTVDENLQSDDD
ncbi:MarR family transcriptional regulator [Rhizobiales bacterium RZME27]|uniref:MarR family transcriptional regulator n=1 Tax=Endobacterium cereale TaxID=2663029 RepID=A0A6A8ADD5_9HYPH|nr:MarR family transcriptional regulator [Endobacterium cereale]MEB2845604.1 MarR family transcriptional regulator [Endobacterium cereale]MQY48769.1 MarR family transcriptional regulator [Endobacterium cereale]